MQFIKHFTLIALLASVSVSQAADYAAGNLRIIQPWARATAPGAQAGGGFLKIDNKGPADRLIAAEAKVSNVVELHTMRMEGNVMRMAKLENGIELPAGQSVELKPGGLHVMFIELKAPLKEGDKFPLRLKFEKAGEITVDVQVQGLGAATPAAMPAGMQHKH